MGLIQRADLPEKIKRAFGIREPGVGSTLSPEIVPVVLVEDLTGPTIDTGYPRLVAAKILAGQSAGVMSECFIINPSSTRTDLILTELWATRTNAAGNMDTRWGETEVLVDMLGTQTQRFNLDLRTYRAPTTTGLPGFYVDSRNQAAALGTLIFNFRVPVSVFEIMPLQFTIPPGMWVSVTPDANNQGAQVVMFGYERLRTTT